MRFHRHFAANKVNHHQTEQQQHVAADDRRREPEREMRQILLVMQAQQNNPRNQQQFVCERIKNRAQFAPLVVTCLLYTSDAADE